jgi:hypothetical protein
MLCLGAVALRQRLAPIEAAISQKLRLDETLQKFIGKKSEPNAYFGNART